MILTFLLNLWSEIWRCMDSMWTSLMASIITSSSRVSYLCLSCFSSCPIYWGFFRPMVNESLSLFLTLTWQSFGINHCNELSLQITSNCSSLVQYSCSATTVHMLHHRVLYFHQKLLHMLQSYICSCKWPLGISSWKLKTTAQIIISAYPIISFTNNVKMVAKFIN